MDNGGGGGSGYYGGSTGENAGYYTTLASTNNIYDSNTSTGVENGSNGGAIQNSGTLTSTGDTFTKNSSDNGGAIAQTVTTSTSGNETQTFPAGTMTIENGRIFDLSLSEKADVPYNQTTIAQNPVLLPDSLYIQAFDENTEIWVNRELVAKGSWREELPPGIHAISTSKDGIESPTQYIMIGDGKGQRIKTPTPYAKYGWLNISSNVVDADVWLDGKYIGKTPCILQPLSTYKKYTLKISKEGYKEEEVTITLKDNDMQNIYLKLKKK